MKNKKYKYVKYKTKQNLKPGRLFEKEKKYSRTEAYVRKYPSNNKQNKSKTKFQQIPLSKHIIF